MSESYKRKHQWTISKHWKRGKETLTGIPTLIYMTSCREVKGREIIRERDQKNISSIQTGGDIDRGSYPFSHDVKGRERERVKHMKSEKDCSEKVYFQGKSLS
jgi:hypothetical protein